MNLMQELNQQEEIVRKECDALLLRAQMYGVQIEVIASAFKHKEQFPKATLLECLQVGVDEWDV